MKPRVVVVTDPMCSWCWATKPHVEAAMRKWGGEVAFDFILGGINTDATQPIGEYGIARLDALWHQVTAVTGQTFSHRYPDGCIYNSVLPCHAVEAARDILGEPPFDYLHRVQELFFVDAANVNDRGVLAQAAGELGMEPKDFASRIDSKEVAARTRWNFSARHRYGANALPSFLFGQGADLALMAGGYIDTEFLGAEIEARLGG